MKKEERRLEYPMKNLKLVGEPQGEPIKPAETVATVEGCPWSAHKKM